MERWQFIRWGIAASVLAHVLVAAAIFLSTDVRTYDQAAPDPIPVDIVAPDEPTPEPTPTPSPTPSPDLTLPDPVTPPSPQPDSSQQAAAQPAPQPQPSQQPKPRETAKPQAKAAPQPQPQPVPPAAPEPPAQSYIPAQPDLTIKYGVRLGLPGTLPPLARSADAHDDDKEAGATATSNLATELVTAFRAHLRTCSHLSGSTSPADNVRVKFRIILTPDGRLADQPTPIEGTASMKGIELIQAAVTALMACQPYTMLPPDRYREWRVLELSFTPQDFSN